MWSPPEGAGRQVTVGDMFKLAKTLRLKTYYDTGDVDDDHNAAAREGRTSALNTLADVVDETFGFDSALTQTDLDGWRR